MLTLPLARGLSDKPNQRGRKPSVIKEEEPDDFNEEYDAHKDEFNNPLTNLLKARNRCKEYSPLYNALIRLNETAKELPYRVIDQLGEHANLLIDSLENPDSGLPEKTKSIELFLTECKKLLGDQHYQIKTILFIVALTAMVLLPIGAALAAWIFSVDIAIAHFSAFTLLAGSLISGAGALAYNNNCLFSPPPSVEAAIMVAGVATHDGLEFASV